MAEKLFSRIKKITSFARISLNSLTGRVLMNAGWASASTPISIGLGILQTGMMARMLGPDGLGAVALFGAVCGLFGSFFKLQSAETIMVYVTKMLAEKDYPSVGRFIQYVYCTDLLTALLSFCLVVISSFFWADFLKLTQGSNMLQIFFSLTLIFQAPYWTSHALLRICNHFSWTFYQAISHSVLKTILVALLFFFKAELTHVIYLLIGLSLFDGLSLYLLAAVGLKKAGVPSFGLSIAAIKGIPLDILHFQLLGHGRQIVKSLNRYVDTVVIGHFGNPMEVGLYRSAKQIADQMQLPAQGFLTSLFPEYSRLFFSGENAKLRRLVYRFGVLFLFIGLLGSIGMWFGAEWITLIVLGKSFLPAIPSIRILLISEVLLLAMSPIYSLPAAAGNAGPALGAAIAGVVLQIGMIAWLVPQQGALGAAWANVSYYAAWTLIMIPSSYKVLSNKASFPNRKG
jgi:O-antigen/teichoic acid export membrane protein